MGCTNHGIGILQPNVRGSTSYGKSYKQSILHHWGGGDPEAVSPDSRQRSV
jgi:dipeptidyl aminopeptidase/acylaminoacyl peptidase